MNVPADKHGESRVVDQADFLDAMQLRRTLVYDYLDNWPGSARFRPLDIHDAIFSYVKRRGKALRPALLLLCCGAVGGDENQALPAAASIEVFHTWTLVHDDIIDRDDTRRGSPTVHAEYAAHGQQVFSLSGEESKHYGAAVAILAGDLQQSWAYGLLSELAARGVDASLVLELVDRMAHWLTPTLLEGEMLDVQYSVTPFEELDEERVLEMLTKKTGALLEYAAWCGAKIGLGRNGDTNGSADKLARFASLCGTAFQLYDDILGLTADEAALGKPVGSDLREGKRTLIVYRALRLAGPEGRSTLLSVLGNPAATAGQVKEAIAAIEATGTIKDIRDLANSLVNQADAFLLTLPPSRCRDLLAAWSSFLIARTF